MVVDSRMTLSGNLTRDPQRRISSRTGDPFAVLAIAVNNRRFDRESKQWVVTGTTYFDLLCWGRTGANVLQSMHKGDPVVVHGRFRLNEWTSENGSGVNPTIDVDSIGPDLTFGTAPFSRGSASYGLERVEDYNPGEEGVKPPGAAERPAGEDTVAGGSDEADLEEYVDEDGVVDDQAAEELLARTA